MKFLGIIGIDPFLLIAQIVNFLLLLWILTRFLYKPIIKKIEENEKELAAAKESKEELEKEKQLFEEKLKKDTLESKAQAQQIIKEAEEIADKIKNKYLHEYEESKIKLLHQTDIILTSKQKKLEQDLTKEINRSLRIEISKKLKALLTPHIQEQLNLYFFNKLIEAVNKLPMQKDSIDTASIIKRLESLSTDSTDKTKAISKEIQKNSVATTGIIYLDHVEPLTDDQKKIFHDLLVKKLGIDEALLNIQNRHISSLLSGYKLEIKGVIIESNLQNELAYEN